MKLDKKKQWCQRCKQPSGIRIVFGDDVASIPKEIREAAEAGEIVLGGEGVTPQGTPFAINTVCLRCHSFWRSSWEDEE